MLGTCVSLYDESGNLLRPWAEAGYTCYCFDLEGIERDEGNLHFIKADVTSASTQSFILSLRPYAIFGFPPCTDVAVSGAKHFERKLRDDPAAQAKAAELALIIPMLAQDSGSIWMFENPKSMLVHHFGPPDHVFHPWEFGGYLPENDIHPRWPDYIPARDAYPKETYLWSGGGYRFPEKAPVYCPPGWSPQTTKLGGKSAKTKQIRSETPRGFAKANFMANRK